MVLRTPPKSITLELRHTVPCPAGCPHCSHESADTGKGRALTPDTLMESSLVSRAADLGISIFVAYPRKGDVSIESRSYAAIFERARSLGMDTKTTTSGMNPEGIAELIPHLSQLTVSLDGFGKEDYTRFRPEWLFSRVMQTLDLIDKRRPADFRLAVNVVTTKSFVENKGIHRFMESAVARGGIDKLNVLEILPGKNDDYKKERLGAAELAILARLKKEYKPVLKITLPSWEAGKPGIPSCPMGRDFLVIGPSGEIAPCVLCLHGGLTMTNLFEEPDLGAAWRKTRDRTFSRDARIELFQAPSSFPLNADLSTCQTCRLFKEERCFGGCVARVRLFGHDFERKRQCRGPIE